MALLSEAGPSADMGMTTGKLGTPPVDDELAMLLSDGQARVLDGNGNRWSSVFLLSSAELYDSSTGAWTLDRNNAMAGSTGQSITLLGTGMVLTAGGTQGAYPAKVKPIPYADLFDPSTGNDVSTGSMNTVRDSHTATLLQNGDVLAAGGFSRRRANRDFIITTPPNYTP